MGMFSYACSKCGGKIQFDWMEKVVVKIAGASDDLYVRGKYDGNGYVEISIAGKDDNTARSVTAYPGQFQQFFGVWDISNNALLASKIYCDGNGSGDDESSLNMHKFVKNQMKALEVLLGRGNIDDLDDDEEDEEPRHCAPDGIEVLEALPEAILAGIPKLNELVRAQATRMKKKEGGGASKESKKQSKEKAVPKKKTTVTKKTLAKK